MNTQLIDAIRQLNLKPGESYTVEVDGRTLVIHDTDAAPSVYEGQVMMVPWFEFPDPTRPIRVSPGSMPPRDPVIIPEDFEDSP
jgi:hypothetical protein